MSNRGAIGHAVIRIALIVVVLTLVLVHFKAPIVKLVRHEYRALLPHRAR